VEYKNVEMFALRWVKSCGMQNLDCKCRSDNLVSLQTVLRLDASCAILMH